MSAAAKTKITQREEKAGGDVVKSKQHINDSKAKSAGSTTGAHNRAAAAATSGGVLLGPDGKPLIDHVEPGSTQVSTSAGLGFGTRHTVVQRPLSNQPRHSVQELGPWVQLIKINARWRKLHEVYPDIGLERVFIIECGKGGDCLYHAVVSGYNHLFGGAHMSMPECRQYAASMITEANVNLFLHAATSTSLFPTDQLLTIEPASRRVATVKMMVSSPGNTYWGETSTLGQLLINHEAFKTHNLGFGVVQDLIAQYRVPSSSMPLATVSSPSGTTTTTTTTHMTTTTTTTTNTTTKTGVLSPHSVASPPPSAASSSSSSAAGAADMLVRKEPKIVVEVVQSSTTEHIMYLYNSGQNHWRLLGLTEPGKTHGVIHAVFPKDSMPTPFKQLML